MIIDIYIITNKKIPEKVLIQKSDNFSKLLGRNPANHDKSVFTESFDVELRNLVFSKLKKTLPLMKYFELKEKGLRLYGEDIKNKLSHINEETIPPIEGTRFLMNRCCLMLEYFKEDFLKRKMTEEEKMLVGRYVTKMYLDGCTALLTAKKYFIPSYKERAKKVKSIYSKEFPQLKKKIPDLDKKIIFYTKIKTTPQKNFNFINIKKWLIAKEDALEILLYCLNELREKNNSEINKNNLAEKIENMTELFYRDYVKNKNILFLNKKIKNKFIFLIPLILNYKLSLRLKKNVMSFKDPGLKIYSVMILLLKSLSDKKTINKEILKKAKEKMDNTVLFIKNEKLSFEEQRKRFADAYRTYSFLKII